MELNWYVLNYDFNNKKVVDFNIFDSYRFSNGVMDLVNEIKSDAKYILVGEYDYDYFVKKLEDEARYAFWSKREYEISVSDAFETNLDMYEKIDVYRQVSMNIKQLADYIIAQTEI